MAKECVTHHHACDCREAKFKLVAQALLEATAHVSEVCLCEDCRHARDMAHELLEAP